MINKPSPRLGVRLFGVLVFCFVALFFSNSTHAQTDAPVLLTEGTGASTRAVAYEAVTRVAEPFSVSSPISWSADARTRIMLFATNLRLLPGEGANALTAEAEDGAGKRYALKVESIQFPSYSEIVKPEDGFRRSVPQSWLFAVTLRLSDEMTNVTGDVLVRISLHGIASNRVRVAIGQTGGGPPTDAVAEVVSPAPAATPTPMPPLQPKAYGANEAASADVTRFLEQASWGPSTVPGSNEDVARVQSMGLRAYLSEQLSAPANNYPDLFFPLDDQNTQCPSGPTQADCQRDNYSLYPVQKTFFTNALYGQSQLRQRVGFALHQIFVVSGFSPLNIPSWYTKYLQALDRNALGSYRTLLEDITLNPAMGDYLDMRLSTRTNQNENWAREVLQLFSIGTAELNLDGTPKLDAQGQQIPTYTQTTVNEFTRAFTGWNLVPGGLPPPPGLTGSVTNWRDPMVPRAGTNHDTGAKTLLNGLNVPACTQSNQQCAQSDLRIALDNIFNHANVGPFIGKQLIQHLVTSNPSPAYVARVARVFNNDCDGLYNDSCTGARGNLGAVARAILLDPEARGDLKTDPAYGKLREPIQYMTNVLRAFNAKSFNKTTTSDGVLAARSSAGDYTALMDQPLFLPATVFSYYSPDYEIPGAKLIGPSFNILSTSTALRRANFVNQMVYSGIAPTTGTNTSVPLGTSLDISALEALAVSDASGSQLVDSLNALLLHGTMSAQMRSSIITAVTSVPTTDASFPRKRTQMAIYLVATSSQYQVQR